MLIRNYPIRIHIILLLIFCISCTKDQKVNLPEITNLKITSKPITTIDIDSKYSYSIEATGDGNTTYQLVDGPNGMTLNANKLSIRKGEKLQFIHNLKGQS